MSSFKGKMDEIIDEIEHCLYCILTFSNPLRETWKPIDDKGLQKFLDEYAKKQEKLEREGSLPWQKKEENIRKVTRFFGVSVLQFVEPKTDYTFISIHNEVDGSPTFTDIRTQSTPKRKFICKKKQNVERIRDVFRQRA